MRNLIVSVSLGLLATGVAVAAVPGPSAPTSTDPSAPPVAPAPMVSAPVSTAPVSMPPANGTLVAVSVGAPCTFSLNGMLKGTNSSIRLDLKPAVYTVTCKTAAKTQSKSVAIKSGQTAMAMFQQN